MTAALNANTNSTSFHYQMLPSSFQLAEAPTYLAWEIFKSAEKLWDLEAENDTQRLINRTLAVLKGVGGYFAGIIALPITLACTPVTILADVIVGIAECSFCYYHGQDIGKIVYIKFVVSPLQQLIFCSAAIATIALVNLVFVNATFWVHLNLFNSHLLSVAFTTSWTFGYAMGQVAVGRLPSILNHNSFNIFVNGGSGESDGQRWLDEDMSPSDEEIPSSESSNSNYEPISSWESYIAAEISNLSPIDNPRAHEKYIAFKRCVFERKSPQELLSLNNNYSQADLRTSFRNLSLILHPDRNGASAESNSLFRILREAFNRLSSHI